jgi:hypothetical protein
MIHWLHKYIFRGLGIVFAIGMITSLVVTILDQMHRESQTSNAIRTVNTAPAKSGR